MFLMLRFGRNFHFFQLLWIFKDTLGYVILQLRTWTTEYCFNNWGSGTPKIMLSGRKISPFSWNCSFCDAIRSKQFTKNYFLFNQKYFLGHLKKKVLHIKFRFSMEMPIFDQNFDFRLKCDFDESSILD